MRETILTLFADSWEFEERFIPELFFPAPFRDPAEIFEFIPGNSDPFMGLRDHREIPIQVKKGTEIDNPRGKAGGHRFLPYRVKTEF